MKFIKKISIYNRINNSYNKLEDIINNAVFGIGWDKSMDYDKDKRGHLLLFSINFKGLKMIKKLFIAI